MRSAYYKVFKFSKSVPNVSRTASGSSRPYHRRGRPAAIHTRGSPNRTGIPAFPNRDSPTGSASAHRCRYSWEPSRTGQPGKRYPGQGPNDTPGVLLRRPGNAPYRNSSSSSGDQDRRSENGYNLGRHVFHPSGASAGWVGAAKNTFTLRKASLPRCSHSQPIQFRLQFLPVYRCQNHRQPDQTTSRSRQVHRQESPSTHGRMVPQAEPAFNSARRKKNFQISKVRSRRHAGLGFAGSRLDDVTQAFAFRVRPVRRDRPV